MYSGGWLAMCHCMTSVIAHMHPGVSRELGLAFSAKCRHVL